MAGLERQLALDDRERRWPRPGRGTAAGPRCRVAHVAVEPLAHGLDQLGDGRTVVQRRGPAARPAAGRGARQRGRRAAGRAGPTRSRTTRRPMAASSTERTPRSGGSHACMMHITPHLSVPSDLPPAQRRRGRPVAPASRLVGGDERPRRRRRRRPGSGDAEAPRPHAEPAEVLHRVAEVGELPVEHRPQPVGSDDAGCPRRKSPWTTRGSVGGGRLASSQRKPELEGRVGLAEDVEHVTELAPPGPVSSRPGDGVAGRSAWIAGQRGAALRRRARAGPPANSSSRQDARAIVSPSTRRATTQGPPRPSLLAVPWPRRRPPARLRPPRPGSGRLRRPCRHRSGCPPPVRAAGRARRRRARRPRSPGTRHPTGAADPPPPPRAPPRARRSDQRQAAAVAG